MKRMKSSFRRLLSGGVFAGALAAFLITPSISADEQVVPEDAALAAIEIHPASSAIVVDGVLDEPAWQDAASIPIPYEIFPGDNIPALVETEMLVSFDSRHFYVACRAHDPDPSLIRAYLADRDESFRDDTCGFLIDTFNDGRRGFQFRVNAVGVQMEAVNSDIEQTEDWSWDIIWDSAGKIYDWGFVVELAIPLKQLRFAPVPDGEVGTWGFWGMRDYPRTDRHRLRSQKFDRERNCTVCQFRKLVGFREVEPGRNLELDPTVTSARTDRRGIQGGDWEEGDEEVDLGLTGRWNITPNVTFNAALNPDFSQVEADSVQLDVNERFTLFFPERRSFFLEGADFFRTGLRAVFTRTVGDPKWGAKVTGKQGRNGYGVFSAEDRSNQLIFPSNQGSQGTSLDEDVFSTVARYRRDVGENSNLGVLYTGRFGEDQYENQVFGIDGTLRPTGTDAIRFQVLGSRTQYDDVIAQIHGQPRGDFDGTAWEIEYSHGERNWFWFAEYRDIDEDFRADSGFMPQVDFRETEAGLQRTFWGEEGDWYRRFEIFAGGDYSRDGSGEIEEWGGDLSLTWFGPLQSLVQVNLAPNHEYFAGQEYDHLRQSIYAEIRPSGRVGVEFFANWGETIDFGGAQSADFVTFSPEIDLQIGRHVNAEISWTNQVFDVDAGELFEANIGEAVVFYHFNRRTFARAILQYRNVERNPETHDFPLFTEKSENFFTQFLFSYKINPQTAILAGYSDDRRGDDQYDLTRVGRSVFLKVGYAFLF